MSVRKSLVVVAIVGVIAGAASYWLWPRQRLNVILITIDTLRPDRLSAYGYTKHQTPNLDRLAREGVLFENAFCDVTWTTPSMASVMTGRYATVHGLRSSYERLSPQATTLAEVLSAQGIHTAALIASFPLDSMFGLDQGFALYDDDFDRGLLNLKVPPAHDDPGSKAELRQFLALRTVQSAYRPDNEQSDRAIRWLRDERQEPFLLWLHYLGPHEKPRPTADLLEERRLQVAQYDPDVVQVDAQVGRVLTTLDELGLASHTAVILHADHGQSLLEHNYVGHGKDLFDPSQHVPLLMRLPRQIPGGVHVRRLVRNIDLFPTILDLVRVKQTAPVDGSSLLPLIAGKDNGEPEETYVETYLSANRLFAESIGPHDDIALGFRRMGIRTPEWKFIINDPIPLVDEDDPAPVTPQMRAQYYSEELYDLRADPGEITNVISAHRDVAAAFWKKLGDYQTRRGPGSEKMALDSASRERLRSLGYLSRVDSPMGARHPTGGHRGLVLMRERKFLLEIALVSMAIILLEISYTRIVSFKLFYYFTFLIIGISLLGIGAGGVFVAIFPRLRRIRPERLIPACCVTAGATVLLGYLVVATTQLNALELSRNVGEVLKLTLVCTFLFTPFLMAGVVIATIFGARPAAINRLYFADLCGAGLGCALCVPLLYMLSPPGTVCLSGLILVLASIPLSATDYRRLFGVAVPVSAALLIGTVFPSWLPDPVPDALKTMSPQKLQGNKILFSQWSPVFRIDVMDWPAAKNSPHIINHDGMMGSTLFPFNGDLATLRYFDTDLRAFPFRVLDKDRPKVLIIGAAGGHEILASLYFGAGHVTGVELNPVTVSLLTTHFAQYSGHLARNDRVTLVNAEGRSFIKGDRTLYDLIWFVAPDSYSAMNAATSGAFVLSESYLYTSEMIEESLKHLRDGGIMAMNFGEWDFDRKPNRTARYLGTAREAFRRLGITDFEKHVLLSTSPSIVPESTILLKRSAFTAGEVDRFLAALQAVKGSKPRFASGHVSSDGAVEKVIRLPETDLPGWYAGYPYDIRPITDDSPFFWHFARFTDALGGSWVKPVEWDVEDAVGERVLMVLLAFVIVFAAVFLVLPLMTMRTTWAAIPYKTRAGIYFAALGMGFMFFEISLIQKLTLFLGYPTYSLTVTLFALLISSGIGSLLSERYRRERNRALMALLGCVTGLTLFYQIGMSPIVDAFVGASLELRIALTVLFLAPLGICLGAFMPLGLQTISKVSEHPAEYIAWAWAVNGFFSVISSILATILSMTIGFRMIQLAGVGIYLVGILALFGVPLPSESQEHHG